MAILAQLVRRRWRLWQNETELQDLLFLSLAVVPVASVIVLNSVLYDGWRQLYFIYPAFVLVSLRGWVALLGWRPGKLRSGWLGVVALGTALSLAHVGHWMARAHPYQNLYFNALAGPDPKMRFDADYWGLTNREALEFIVSHDKRASINVWPGSWTRLADSTLMLRASDRVRVRVVVDQADADYIVTNYRGDRRDYASENPEFRLFHQVTVDGHVVNATYMRLKPRFPRP